MLYRTLTLPLHRAAQSGAPVLLQGPRSAGKSTLLRHEFPAHTYLSLDDPPTRARAREDPEAFLARLRGPAILDDLHRAPDLAAYLALAPPRPLLLASSRRLRLPFLTLELHLPTRAELQRRPPLPLSILGRFVPAPAPPAPAFPPWPLQRSFVEHDIPSLAGVRDLDRFERFLQAARDATAEVLDQQKLATASGISHSTATRWLTALDACFQILLLPPTDLDFGRRLIRRPKLHFLSSSHFESQSISEIFRNAQHGGVVPDLRYWRDSNGFEIPLVLLQADAAPPLPVEFAGQPNPAAASRLRRWMHLAQVPHAALIGLNPSSSRAGGILRYSIDQL